MDVDDDQVPMTGQVCEEQGKPKPGLEALNRGHNLLKTFDIQCGKVALHVAVVCAGAEVWGSIVDGVEAVRG